MVKYLLKRLLHGLISVVIVIAIVMIFIYSLMDRQLIFKIDSNYTHTASNQRDLYRYKKWKEYGYLDLVQYNEYLILLKNEGTITEEEASAAIITEWKAKNDNPTVQKYTKMFRDYYQSKGYTVYAYDADTITTKGITSLKNGGERTFYAYKDIPVLVRLWKYITRVFQIDKLSYAEGINDSDRKIEFTLHDPLYGGEKFSPAIMGYGTKYRYLLYMDNKFPYIHQNVLHINLGVSYAINQGIDIYNTMTDTQGGYDSRTVIYPSGVVGETADNLHTLKYSYGSNNLLVGFYSDKFVDDYTEFNHYKLGKSRIGYSFIIGIISTVLSYLLGVPLGIILARHKDGVLDKLGTIYIVFIIAVPSLSYIFMFNALGRSVFKLPVTFMTTQINKRSQILQYVLPVISLTLPSVAGLMKWLRRYMIDQMNSDYVKFARSGGLSESEIFRKHIFKNAAIPIVHGIPGSVLFSLTGAIITERVYVIPGVGNVLTNALNAYDNSVIVGVTLFYALLSIVSIILGDILMALLDPRISFSTKGRQ